MTGAPKALRAGVIGAGLMGRWHAQAIQRVGGRVVAVVDQDLGLARALARRLPEQPAVGADIGAALHEHRLDVLHVCTPVATHEAIARQAFEAGVSVLVEKPVAPDAAAVERLHGLAQAHGVTLCPVYQFLFQPGVLVAEYALPRLGAIRHFDVVTCSAGADGGTEPERESVALDILPHGLSLARRLIGLSLAAAEWRVAAGSSGEIRALAEAGSASISLTVSTRSRPTENSLTMRCDHGTVRADLFHGFATVERGEPSRADKVGRPFIGSAQVLGAAIGNLAGRAMRRELAYPGLRELVRRFHEACAAGGASPVSVEESIDVARARDRIATARIAARR